MRKLISFIMCQFSLQFYYSSKQKSNCFVLTEVMSVKYQVMPVKSNSVKAQALFGAIYNPHLDKFFSLYCTICTIAKPQYHTLLILSKLTQQQFPTMRHKFQAFLIMFVPIIAAFGYVVSHRLIEDASATGDTRLY